MNRMKIVIGYDGSECADTALGELLRAGLPAEAEAIVISVADVVLPPRDQQRPGAALSPAHVPEIVRHAWARAEKALEEAHVLAARASERVKAAFPGWQVRAEACADSPAWAIVKLADTWGPDLVVVGTHGHNVMGGRLILGSVSQRVLYEARCSVRVVRCAGGRREGAVRIVVGFDGSADAAAAVNAVARRSWSQGSEVLVVTAADPMLPAQPEEPAALLRAVGLSATVHMREGVAAQILLAEAEKWGADCIFVGAKSRRGVERFLLGSVPLALAARAHCTVEVVRASP